MRSTSRLGLVLASIACAVLAAASASAVHDEDFELDGNILGADPAGGPEVDWSDLFTTGSVATPPQPVNSPPAGFGTGSFDRDFEVGGTSDDSYFATGSKDTLNPSDGWQCKKVNNSGDKFDLLNVYATPYTAPNGDVIIYFAAERVKNEGVTNVGFWFFQDSGVGCVVPNGGANDFVGNHVDGDLFIVSEYTNGGDVNTILVYEWQGGPGGALNPTPVVSGADCSMAAANDTVCAIVNDTKLVGSGAGTDIPWLTQTFDKGNILTELDVGLFFEGGLNLTQAGLGACFTQYMGVTRSSFELGSDLKDYSLNQFNLCSCAASKVSACVDFSSDGMDITFNNEGVVTIENDGGAPLPANSIECCDSAADECKTLTTELMPGDTADLVFNWMSSTNGGTNDVTCTADLGGGASTSCDADATIAPCSASPDLYVDKECSTKLVFDDPVGRTTVKVLANGQVCNTSAESGDDGQTASEGVPLINVAVTDNKAGSLLSGVTLDAGTPCDTDQDCTDAGVGGDCVGADTMTGKDGVCRGTDDGTDGTFFDGDVCADYTGMYLPSTTDDGTMVPADAEFSDTVTATGAVDDDLGASVSPEMATATCELCPPDQVCDSCP